MSILGFGGEMGFFIPSDASATEQASLVVSDLYDPAFTRCAVISNNTGTYAQTASVTETADIWIHLDVRQYGSVADYSSLITALTFLNGSGVEVFRLQTGFTSAESSNYTWQLQYLLGAVWTNIGGTFTTSGARQTLDLHIVCNTASGSLDAYISGTQRAASGTVNLSAIAGVAAVRNYGASNIRSGGDYVALSQVIFATESTIGWRLGTIVMTGQGATHTFDVGGFAAIDEAVYSDADEISSGTTGQVELFTGTPIPTFTGYTIKALGIYARAKKSGSGPAQMQLALRSAGTTYFSATKALGFGYGAIGNVWTTNPATSAAFLSSEIPALQYGVQSIT